MRTARPSKNVGDFNPQSQAVGPSASLPMNSKASPSEGTAQRTPQAYQVGGGTARPGKVSGGHIETKPGS